MPNRLITTRSREARKGRARRETRGSEQTRKAGGEERLTWRVPQLFIEEDPISYCPRIDVGAYCLLSEVEGCSYNLLGGEVSRY